MKKLMFFLTFHLLFLISNAQNQILMTIGQDTVYTDEFEELYTKNLDLVQDPQQKDIDFYKDLFIKYKLQLLDARAKNYHKDWNFRNEFNKYRRELAKKYLTDPSLQEKLLQEAYERMQKDIKVSHIMIRLSENAPPEDTLKSWKKIQHVYKQLNRGTDFETAALKYSEDPSVKNNKGHLGWINVFHTVYPFETAAYQTPVGKYSRPFRTKYGYHIVYKEDERPAVYKVQVAQILVLKNQNPEQAKQKILSIYEQLKKDEDTFENLAKQFSEDPQTAKSGGIMPPFGIREKIPEFESQAFALKKPGDFSEPFETRYAWHIIKLIKKIPVPSFEQIKPDLEVRIAKSDRSKLGKEKLIKKLKKDFPIQMKNNVEPVYALLDKNFFNHTWTYPKDFKLLDSVLFVINREYPVTYRDFINFLYRKQMNNPEAYNRKKELVNQWLENFKEEQLYRYYENNLEKFYPDFAKIIREYRNGLLLFNYKTKEIWEKALKDSLGLKEFYEKNKEKYRQKNIARTVYAQTTDKKLAKKILKAVKQKKSLEELMKLAGKKAVVHVKMMPAELAVKQQFKTKPKLIKQDNKYIVRGVLETIPERIPPLKEIRGKVMSDYQTELEKRLTEKLKKKYPVKIHEENWKKIRAKYKS